ncbi:uncharacterized protein NEMAJ01_1914 [Nematocida major]|uniref:uncharacterized protein n=1 Tax=Nematocida major TaxID=1912982 RepID=UPI002007B30C|nr:uncharacterized protein NEMAJ01_1914 [Nematocida major]KAH9387018.1 hypothetical protein NEMAJ01_1914 [Nematocida major]
MYSLSTTLLLLHGSLTVLSLSVARSVCFLQEKNKEVFLFLLLSKICSFFLFSKGTLLGRTIEQKYAAFVTVFEILSGGYLSHVEKMRVLDASLLVFVNGLSLWGILAGIHNTHMQVPYKTQRRLLSGEMEILCYNITTAGEILLFISQFACTLYIISETPVVSKVVVSVFLLQSIWGSGRALIFCNVMANLWAFKDVLISPSMCSISLFVSSTATLGALLAGNYLSWSMRNPTAQRVTVE